MKNFDPVQYVKDDGLHYPKPVGKWSLQKYRLIGRYMDMFTSSMKYKWRNLVYIDLFSAAGYAKLKRSGKVLKSSSQIALSLPNKFSHYILIEKDLDNFNALKTRFERNKTAGVKALYYNSNANSIINTICNELDKINSSGSTLTLCFIDPFSLNIHFNSLKKLSRFKIDYLMLLALKMDAGRNISNYKSQKSKKVDRFLGDNDWRQKFANLPNQRPIDFRRFLANTYKNKMIELGFDKSDTHEVLVQEKNLGLYHLAIFSTNPLAERFFKIARQYANNQGDLFQ